MTTRVAAGSFKQIFLGDLLASIVVFLVALPLCMGIAIASGVPPEAGLLTGIIGGLVVSTLGGCELQVSGPAAGLAVVMVELVQKFGFERMAVIIALAGLIQVLAGVFKLAQWFRAVPPSVIHGMLSGIGILIFASQFHVMIDDMPKGTGINNMLSLPMAIMKAVTPDASLPHEEAALVGAVTLATILIWEKVSAQIKPLKTVPSSLVAIAIASFVTAGWSLPIKLVSLPDSLMTAIHIPTIQTITNSLHTDVFGAALMVAFIASAETLLTAAALDKMHRGKRTNYDKELMAQGVGNTVSGLVGGLPLTGVMVRSGVNLTAGAKTRLSGILHGFWLLAAVALIPHVVSRIPTSALAALLVHAGWKLANIKMIKELARISRGEVIVFLVTVVVIVSTDLLTGVITGVVLAAAKLLHSFSHLEIHVKIDTDRKHTEVILKGAATFLVLPRLAEAIESVHPDSELHVNIDGLDFIDHACLDFLQHRLHDIHLSGGRKTYTTGHLPRVQ